MALLRWMPASQRYRGAWMIFSPGEMRDRRRYAGLSDL